MEISRNDSQPLVSDFYAGANILHDFLFKNSTNYYEIYSEYENDERPYTVFEYVHKSCGSEKTTAIVSLRQVDGDVILIYFDEKILKPWEFTTILFEISLGLINHITINSDDIDVSYQANFSKLNGN